MRQNNKWKASQAFYNGLDDDTIVTPEFETKEKCVEYLKQYEIYNAVKAITKITFINIHE